MEKKKEVSLWEIAEENFKKVFGTANGQMIIWIDGTVSYLYGNSQPAHPENVYLTHILCDGGNTIETAELEENSDWYIERLYADLQEKESCNEIGEEGTGRTEKRLDEAL